MASYEVEIKSLLGDEASAGRFREQLIGVGGALLGRNKQRNHYFKDGDAAVLFEKTSSFFADPARIRLGEIIRKGKDFSVRTRQKDEEVLLVVKASVDSGTSANAVARMEFEEPVSVTLDTLDALLEKAGFSYQAKWSREREEYACRDCTVTVDKNAGYGYLAEFEWVVEEGVDRDEIAAALRALMAALGAQELPQDRLERMFAYYNEHWPEYYGTDKTFIIA